MDAQRWPLKGWAKTRPVRVAFLVELTDECHLALDGIFADSHSRWGGRYSLIVPCTSGRIDESYWPWLETFDPDIVYAYTDLHDAQVLEIHERLFPADYIRHRIFGESPATARQFKPSFPYPLLSSMSSLFRLARHSPAIESGSPLKIIAAWHTEQRSRFLTDNLGCYGLSAGTSILPNDARPAAELLTIVSDKYRQDRKYAVPPSLIRVPSEAAAFAEFAHGRATGVSLLSSYFAPRLEIRDHHWSGAFSLVLGESVQDRILFWNSRLLIPAWLDRDLCCLRLGLGQLQDADFVQDLARMLNARNHVNAGSGGQPQIAVRSCSHNLEELKGAVGVLRAAKIWSAFLEPQAVSLSAAVPNAKALEHANELAGEDGAVRGGWREFDWKPPQSHPPTLQPEHLSDAPPQQAFTLGLWALDLRFEAPMDPRPDALHRDLSLPKRWRLAGAFSVQRQGHGLRNQLPPGNRCSRGGNLTVFDGEDVRVTAVTVPKMIDAFYVAFCRDAAPRYGADQPPWPTARAHWIRASNEAQYLNGVVGLAGDWQGAKRLLLHPFLRQLFASLGATPGLVDAEIADSVNSLVKLARVNSVFDLSSDAERKSLANLIAKAAQKVKSPRLTVPLSKLHEQWQQYREAYWAKHQHQRSASAQGVDWDARERDALDECLVEMRSKRLLFQGFPWACDICKHRNWVDFQALKGTLSCAVCNATTPLPVTVAWHFRANEFLIESLRFHSTLSLLWALAALKARSRRSFVFVGPTAVGFEAGVETAATDADLLAIVDGQAVLCEVKSTWTSVRAPDIGGLVALAKRLRPDLVVLAVMEEGGARFSELLADAGRQLLAVGISLEVLTPDKYSVSDDPFLFG